MRAIIITFHSELNYGAVLQAYALQAYLKKNNCAKILDFAMKTENNKGMKNFVGHVISLPKKYKFRNFLKTKMDLTDTVNSFEKIENKIKQFEYAIVGSDQVWAFDLINGLEKLFYLDMELNNTKKISYAASFGKDDNIINNKKIIYNYLNNFDKISIREESSNKILNDMKLNSINVIDPTLLLDEKEYIKHLGLKKKEKKYILVYMLVIDEEIIDIVNKLNKELDMDIICFNNKNRFGKKCTCKSNSSPIEFVELFYNASFVVTNSFHGTCFSIIFKKKFICVAHKTKGIRQISLLKKAGLEERLYSVDKNIKSYLEDNIEIKEEFYDYIKLSKKYLDDLN